MEITDKERLDFLQSLRTDYGLGWVVRMSSTGRGWRIMETYLRGAKRQIRDAIDDEINRQRGAFDAMRRGDHAD